VIVEAAKEAGTAKELMNHFSFTTDATNDWGNPRTVLHNSVVIGNEDLVNYLLENGADLLLSDRYKYTALHLAIQDGKIATVHIAF